MAGVLICLCAQWCDICERWRPVFDDLAREHQGGLRFRWLDIEDEEELLGSIEVRDFPTLLLADEGGVRQFGVVRADAGSLRRLLERWSHGDLEPVACNEAQDLALRIAAEPKQAPRQPHAPPSRAGR